MAHPSFGQFLLKSLIRTNHCSQCERIDKSSELKFQCTACLASICDACFETSAVIGHSARKVYISQCAQCAPLLFEPRVDDEMRLEFLLEQSSFANKATLDEAVLQWMRVKRQMNRPGARTKSAAKKPKSTSANASL